MNIFNISIVMWTEEDQSSELMRKIIEAQLKKAFFTEPEIKSIIVNKNNEEDD
jgi:hypothetical protein